MIYLRKLTSCCHTPEEILLALQNFDSLTSIWFCIFASYQADQPEESEDRVAQSENALENALENAFKSVIQNVHEVYVVHTSQTEVYDRLWCAYEISTALDQKVGVRPLFAGKYLEGVLGKINGSNDCWSPVNTQHALTSDEKDRKMITEAVDKKGGFNCLDKKVKAWRSSMIQRIQEHVRQHPDLSKVQLVESLKSLLTTEGWSFGAQVTGQVKTVAIFADYDGCFDIISPSNPAGAKLDNMVNYADQIGRLRHPRSYAENVLKKFLGEITAGAEKVILFSGSNRQSRKADDYNALQNDNGSAMVGLKQLAEARGWHFNPKLLEDVGVNPSAVMSGKDGSSRIKQLLAENNFTCLKDQYTEVYFFDDVEKYLNYTREKATIPENIKLKTVWYDWYGICIDGTQDAPLIPVSANDGKN